jgi:tRNA threonylcarbamoyladenosine dehydratase
VTFRVRILPVLGSLPALFGLHIAAYVLCELAAPPIERPLPVRHRKKLYERMWKDLLDLESRIAAKQIKYAWLSPAFGAGAPPANRIRFAARSR